MAYWSLDVEEIGYLYEGLLDHRVARAENVPLVKMRGAGEEAVPITELEQREGQDLHDFILEHMGRSRNDSERSKIAGKLEEGPSEADLRALARFSGAAPQAQERARPFAPIIQCAEVVPVGWRCLTTGTSRRTSGSFYTPQDLTSRVVQTTLEPLVYVSEEGKTGKYVLKDGEKVLKSPRELLDLKICDMAMGSGAFLVQVVRYLGDRLIEVWDQALVEAGEEAKLTYPYAEPSQNPARDRLIDYENRDEMLLEARRIIASRCVYGVDKNRLATEMAKLSLWLVTLGRDVPFTFLDHALKTGDSLVGVNRRQLETWNLEEKGEVQLPLGLDAVTSALNAARETRLKIESKPIEDITEEAAKRRLLQQAEEQTKLLRLGGDLLIAPEFSEKKITDRKALRQNFLEQFQAQGYDRLRAQARAKLDGMKPFHWFLEFPEVFQDRGFHAFVGNPPFLGGQHITGALGKAYRDFIVTYVGGGTKGSADLVSYFFLGASNLTRESGFIGLLATNTISEGATREVGLNQLVLEGLIIYFAIPSMPWPGESSLEVANVHLTSSEWKGDLRLDGRTVERLSPFLDAGPAGEPKKLHSNEDLSFQGSIILGLGFTMTPQRAEELAEQDSRHAEVLQPFLTGQDLNSSSTQRASRWVINFHNRSEDEAKSFPLLYEIVRKSVRPKRLKDNRETYRKYWWRYAEKRPALYLAIGDLARVLVRSRVSEYHMPVFCPTGQVFSEQVVVFASDQYDLYATLQSSVHEWWARRFSSSLRTDMRYTPSDCFETFPFPQPDPQARIPALEQVGRRFHDHRASLLTERDIGLTPAQQLFYDQECQDQDVAEMRRLFVEMDHAVLSAYGWGDLDLKHGYYEDRRGRVRYTICQEARDELLNRLFELNQQRYQQEVLEGLHGKKKQKAVRAQCANSNQGSLFD